MGIRVKVGFKYIVAVLHRLGGEGCYVGKGNEKNFLLPLAAHLKERLIVSQSVM